MASTRNKNTTSDYCLEQEAYQQSFTYNTYENSFAGRAYSTAIPEVGYMPSHMPMNSLSYNPIEIETTLRGIGANNLVNPTPIVKPELHDVKEVSFFERMPLVMGEKFEALKDQRPYPIPE